MLKTDPLTNLTQLNSKSFKPIVSWFALTTNKHELREFRDELNKNILIFTREEEVTALIKNIAIQIKKLKHETNDEKQIQTLKTQLLRYKPFYDKRRNSALEKLRSAFITTKSNELTKIKYNITLLLNKYLKYLHERAEKEYLKNHEDPFHSFGNSYTYDQALEEKGCTSLLKERIRRIKIVKYIESILNNIRPNPLDNFIELLTFLHQPTKNAFIDADVTLKQLMSVDDTPVNLLKTGKFNPFSEGRGFVSNLEKFLEDFKKIKKEHDSLKVTETIDIYSFLGIGSATADAKLDAKSTTGTAAFFASASASATAATGSAAAGGPPSTATAAGLKPDEKPSAKNTLSAQALDGKTMPNHKSKS